MPDGRFVNPAMTDFTEISLFIRIYLLYLVWKTKKILSKPDPSVIVSSHRLNLLRMSHVPTFYKTKNCAHAVVVFCVASPLGGKWSDWHLSFSNIRTNIYAQSHIFQTGLPSSQKNSRPVGEEKVPGRRLRGHLRVLTAFSSAVWTRQEPDSTKSVGTPGRNKSVCWVSQKNI